MVNKKWVFVALCISGLSILAAQQKRKATHFLTVSGVGTVDKIRDQAISSQTFQGISGGAFIEYQRKGKRFLSKIQFRFVRGFFGDELFDPGQKVIDHSQFKLKSDLFYKINANTKQYSVFAGLRSISRFEDNQVLAFNNNQSNQIGLFEFGPSVLAHRSFYFWNRDWILEGEFYFPVLSYLNRPQFTLPSFDGKTNETISFVGDYFSLKTALKFGYVLDNGNRLFFQYNWEYWQYSPLNKIQRAEHALALGIDISL